MEESAGQWLEKALSDLCQKMETGLGLDSDMISGLVSYCELAHPQDAKEYLDVKFSLTFLLPKHVPLILIIVFRDAHYL